MIKGWGLNLCLVLWIKAKLQVLVSKMAQKLRQIKAKGMDES
jgi:hypothetical protein